MSTGTRCSSRSSTISAFHKKVLGFGSSNFQSNQHLNSHIKSSTLTTCFHNMIFHQYVEGIWFLSHYLMRCSWSFGLKNARAMFYWNPNWLLELLCKQTKCWQTQTERQMDGQADRWDGRRTDSTMPWYDHSDMSIMMPHMCGRCNLDRNVRGVILVCKTSRGLYNLST